MSILMDGTRIEVETEKHVTSAYSFSGQEQIRFL